MRQRLTLPDADLAADYRSGESVSRLSLRYGCSPATIAKRLRAQGVRMRSTRYRPVSVSREELERLYVRERLPLSVIAQRLGISVSTLGNKRREYGIPARSTRGRKPRWQELQERRERRPLWQSLAPSPRRRLIEEDSAPLLLYEGMLPVRRRVRIRLLLE